LSEDVDLDANFYLLLLLNQLLSLAGTVAVDIPEQEKGEEKSEDEAEKGQSEDDDNVPVCQSLLVFDPLNVRGELIGELGKNIEEREEEKGTRKEKLKKETEKQAGRHYIPATGSRPPSWCRSPSAPTCRTWQ
jgi:hypothetical protein